MEKLEINWKPLVKNSEEGKYFFRLTFDGQSDKYFAFCYVGYLSIMDNPRFEGERYKEVVVYLKKKIGNKKYKQIYEKSFRIEFYASVIASLFDKCDGVVATKIAAEERKDKIKLLLGN